MWAAFWWKLLHASFFSPFNKPFERMRKFLYLKKHNFPQIVPSEERCMDFHILIKDSGGHPVFKTTLSRSDLQIFCPNTAMKGYKWKDRSSLVLSVFILKTQFLLSFLLMEWFLAEVSLDFLFQHWNVPKWSGALQYCFLYVNNEFAHDSVVHGLRSIKPLRAEIDRKNTILQKNKHRLHFRFSSIKK